MASPRSVRPQRLSLFVVSLAVIWIWQLILIEPRAPAARAAPLSDPEGAPSAPVNIVCLPFAQPTITEYNGDLMEGPYVADATQTFVTWRDESSVEDNYHVYRQIGAAGSWEEIATLPPNAISYLDTGLNETGIYRYRVRASQDSSFSGYSDTCQKPAFVDSDDDNFRVFYRPYFPDYCPEVENLDGEMEVICSTEITAQTMADRLQASYEWIIEYGFPDPVNGDMIPADLIPCDTAGCARSEDGTRFIGLDPTSMGTPFSLAGATGEASVRVPRHELLHLTQGGLTDPARSWVSEGQARSTDDKHCLDGPTCNLTLDSFPGSAYFNDVQDYLQDPNRPLVEISYESALFWTYITEQYGTLNQEPERGIDFLAQFWTSVQAISHNDAIEVVDHALDEMDGVAGAEATFEDVFKAFVVANYVKDLTGAPAHYRYSDESQPPGGYGQVTRTVSDTLSVGEQYIAQGEDAFVTEWGAAYYHFELDAGVPSIDVQLETFTGNELFYALLAIKNGNIVEELTDTGPWFAEALPNDAFDQVVLVVAGLEEGSNFDLSINATSPELRVLDPLTSRQAQGGDPAVPEKILIKVEVLSPEGGGEPIPGIDPASFDISIGGVAVPASQLITSAYIQGQYWLLVRAPAQPALGDYDLTVENDTVVAGGVVSDTEVDAVAYNGPIESDNIVVGDRSASMLDFDKLDAAQDAARLYVDSWDTGDQLGVISYNETPNVDLSLRPWNNTSREDAFEEINDWIGGGQTGIGAALLESLVQFDDEGDDTHPWNVVLLSDGEETVDEPNLQDFIDEYNARKDASPPVQVPIIHAVALGANADQEAMQSLASDTGGTYHFAGEAAGALNSLLGGSGILNNHLAEVYRVVGETISLEQQIYSAQDSLPVGLAQHTHRIHVDGSASEAVFAVNWVQTGNPTEVEVVLRRPDNSIVTQRRGDPNHYLYRVPLPAQGEWTISIFYRPPGRDVQGSGGSFDYLVEAALKSDLTMELFLGLAPEERWVGEPMPMLVSLSDVAPLPGAVVEGIVTSPSGFEYSIDFYDDGAHSDGTAGDGFYGALFPYTWQAGSYGVVVEADGNSALHGPYTRRLRTSFYMRSGPDSDGDRLPDHWEEEHGLDPHTFDPTSSDPDGDGLVTYLEFTNGTHPLDPDTDNGGEGDGSEVNRGNNPVDDPDDDGLAPPRSVGWAGSGQLWLTLALDDRYEQVRILRAPSAMGPWSQYYTDTGRLENQWRDERVTNDTEYCYRVIGVGARGIQSASLQPTCLTPRLDPIPPQGKVAINFQAGSTLPLTALLSLAASDAPQDVHFLDENDPPVHEGTTPSGVSEMMISNHPGFEGAEWEPYRARRSWRLQPENGIATVYLRFRDRAGNVSERFSDSILAGRFDVPSTLYLPVTRR